MLGLVVVGAIAAYLLVSIIVLIETVSWARKHGRNAKRWGWGAVLFMYLLVAWEQIPIYLLHKYYCATAVGYWVYKTPEQWKAENPGVAQTLQPPTKNLPRYQLVDHEGTGDILNERFAEESRVFSPPLLPVAVVHDVVVDRQTGEVMARSVTVSSGYGQFPSGRRNSWKVWVGADTCWPKGSKIRSLVREFKYIGGCSK